MFEFGEPQLERLDVAPAVGGAVLDVDVDAFFRKRDAVAARFLAIALYFLAATHLAGAHHTLAD